MARFSATNDEITLAASRVYSGAAAASDVGVVGLLEPAEWKNAQNRVLEGLLPHPAYPARLSQALHKVVGFDGGSEFGVGGLSATDAIAVGHIDIFGADSGQWHGKTAVVFKDFFVDPFDNCRLNQIDAVRELDIAIRNLREALDKRRGDYVTIAETTAEVLQGVTGIPGINFADKSLSLAIIGSVISVAGAIPTGGGSLSAKAVLGAATGAAVTGISVSEKISGMYPDTIVQSMYQALDEVDTATETIAADVASKLDEYRDQVFEPAIAKSISYNEVPVILPKEPYTEATLTVGNVDGLNQPD